MGVDDLKFATGGVSKVKFNNFGRPNQPAYNFVSDTNTGIYFETIRIPDFISIDELAKLAEKYKKLKSDMNYTSETLLSSTSVVMEDCLYAVDMFFSNVVSQVLPQKQFFIEDGTVYFLRHLDEHRFKLFDHIRQTTGCKIIEALKTIQDVDTL